MRGSGSVYRRTRTRPNGQTYTRYMAQVSIGGGRYVRRQFETRREATRALEAMLASTEVSRQALGAYLRSWLAETARPRVTPNTLRGYEAAISHLAPVADIALEDLTPEDVQHVVNRMTAARHRQVKAPSPASPKTRRNALAMLRAALADAERRGHLTRNVAAMVDMPRVPRVSREAMTPERAKAIRAAIAGDRYEAAYLLAFCSLRASEVLGLVWSDLDAERRTVRVRYQLAGSGPKAVRVQTKTRTSARPVPIPPFVTAALVAHEERQRRERPVVPIDPAEDSLVFVTERGYAVNGSWLTRHFGDLLAAAKLPGMRVHDLRHGLSALLAGIHVHPSVAQAILGHTTARMTLDAYTAVTWDAQREAMDRLDEAIG